MPMYTCVKKAQARAGFEMDSDKAEVVAVGAMLEASPARRPCAAADNCAIAP